MQKIKIDVTTGDQRTRTARNVPARAGISHPIMRGDSVHASVAFKHGPQKITVTLDELAGALAEALAGKLDSKARDAARQATDSDDPARLAHWSAKCAGYVAAARLARAGGYDDVHANTDWSDVQALLDTAHAEHVRQRAVHAAIADGLNKCGL